jgi:hypothetical protein
MATTTYGIYSGNRRATHKGSTGRRAQGGMPASKLYGVGFGAPKQRGQGRVK